MNARCPHDRTGFRHATRLAFALASTFALGCSEEAPRKPRALPEPHLDDAHGHSNASPTALLGNFPLGHLELSKAPDDALEIHLLELDAATALPIDAATLTVELTSMSGTQNVEFRASPLPGEAPRTSRFLSPPRIIDANVSYEVATYLAFQGKNYRVRFPSLGPRPTDSHGARGHASRSMRTAEDQELWFVPRGKYTAADIAANGTLTAYEKFADIDPDHADPEPGEIVCPISKSRPNPKIVWQIDGKLYSFCCPPCIEDMVQRAKDDPDSILPPEHYVRK